ncbi:DNA mismatch repair protein MutS [Archaeoglobus veneficus]|uniref:DNA-binding protein MutS2 n=1 Tax=Archaeoglobus veneficus (strain DSM 11195 / SNP6) TaxID=693661 RepID=F2KTB2_ARCVS|nr:DNA mismatch repair protein MutS [Archaeoglobus veneficus]AEA47142.1 DNA mismatch repair protein MutS domain protein [Archaeoglobus veneficus SNP6]
MRLSGDAGQIYRQIIREIHSRVRLDGAKLPLKPKSSREEIERMREKLRAFTPHDIPANIKPLKVKKEYLNDRILFVREEDIDKVAKLNLCKIDAGEPGLRIGREFFELETDEKSNTALEVIVAPEIYVKAVYENLENLKALADLMLKAFGSSVVPEVLSEVEKIAPLMERARLAGRIEEIVAEEALRLNRRIEEKISELEVTIKGERILELMRGRVPEIEELESFIAEEVIESERKIEEITGINAEIFSRSYPVEVNTVAVDRIKAEIEEEAIIELYKACRPVAEKIFRLLPEINREVEKAYELEFLRAVKEFCSGFVFPEFSDCIAFVNGKHLFIPNPQPVSYAVGNSEIASGKIAILTGANSGGKTSLLELIAQMQIMAQMGLPVNAEMAWTDVVDELFFFKRKRGVQGAGAFESAVRAFTRALLGKGRKLVLIDEFEAITEPGAAVRIIAEFLRIAHEKDHYVVIVSHLGKELSEMLPFARVDGIEAKGLDENFNLIVDRQPKFGRIGRSTPELILEKLYRKAKGEEKDVLERVCRSVRD